jgi:hypothetical protein
VLAVSLRAGREVKAALIFIVLLIGCGDDCPGCPKLIELACTCYGEDAGECLEAKEASRQACDDNPQNIEEICRTAEKNFKCE